MIWALVWLVWLPERDGISSLISFLCIYLPFFVHSHYHARFRLGYRHIMHDVRSRLRKHTKHRWSLVSSLSLASQLHSLRLPLLELKSERNISLSALAPTPFILLTPPSQQN
jgi:hypothetical protein